MIGFALKNILILFSVTLILISFSCSDTDSVNSPLQSDSAIQLNRFSDCQFYISKIIDGSIGGEILVDTVLMNLQGNLVRVEARLKIDSLSFEGTREIRIIPNVNDASIKLFPKMKFSVPVKLHLIYTGLDLEKLKFTWNSNVGFVFISDVGIIEPVEYNFCTINWQQQQLRVSNAKLSHFSRYAFIK